MFDCVYSTLSSLPLYKKHNGDDAHQSPYISQSCALRIGPECEAQPLTSTHNNVLYTPFGV